MTDKIKTTPLVGNHCLIENPELIKIQTIKKKHVDELPSFPIRYGDDIMEMEFEIIGIYHQSIVVRGAAGRLWQLRKIDYIQSYVQSTNEPPIHAHLILEKCPQLFSA